MNLVFNLWLTANATSWMLIVYAIKDQWTVFAFPYWLVDVLLILLLIFSSWLALALTKCFGEESLHECQEVSLADNEFLPVYLGYFFVSLSVSDFCTMIAVYLLLFCFTFLSRSQYFNPTYLLFGYHYYHVLTPGGTQIFVMKHGDVLRNNASIELNNLRRINNSTFIERR